MKSAITVKRAIRFFRIGIGDLFATPFEAGCRATSDVADDGTFTGIDAEGVECSYHIDMVVWVEGDPA